MNVDVKHRVLHMIAHLLIVELILIAIIINSVDKLLEIFPCQMVDVDYKYLECVDKVGVNSTCGGYVMPGYENRCMDGLECVQTMGPMIADAPGQCREPCNSNERRDDYGNCIVLNTPTIPDNCATWNDGCNTCQSPRRRAEICTLMYCFRQAEPYCMSYHIQSNSLGLNDICYRDSKRFSNLLIDDQIVQLELYVKNKCIWI